MPRDLMHIGPRPSGPRPAIEFDELSVCRELDREEAGGSGDVAATSDDSEESNIPAFYDPTA